MPKKNNNKNLKTILQNSETTQRKKSSSNNALFIKEEYSFIVVALIGFLISLSLLVFCYQYFGSYFEMNDDPRYVMAMKGFASPLPYKNFVSVYLFTVDLYISLYKYFPNIGWYGFSMFLLLWGALFNLFIMLYLFAKKRIKFYLIILLFIAFYFLIFIQNVYWINFTRPSILATSSFILLLGALYLNTDILKNNKWILAFPSLIYILAHLTRLDAGYLGFIFGTASSLLIISNKKEVFPYLLKFILPVIIFIFIVKIADAVSQKNNPRNSEFLEKTEIIRQLIDYRNVSAYVPLDKKDTIAFNALMNARYANDNKIISLDFLKKLTNDAPLLESGNKKKFDNEFGAFVKSLKEENSVARNVNYSFLILVLIWFLSSIRNNLSTFLKY